MSVLSLVWFALLSSLLVWAHGEPWVNFTADAPEWRLNSNTHVMSAAGPPYPGCLDSYIILEWSSVAELVFNGAPLTRLEHTGGKSRDGLNSPVKVTPSPGLRQSLA
ncbi:hypothetical protein EXIGLDRAFT_694716 [Exidia glandulosa HHB12029]|uniref:Uncharacterized protein n=1 Tax=Exidia glandulosa HHB12029 TaxID=1314781 RepID=A0A165GDY5_EXIGL|nr:hypothetical protein EXIGLDRAFT_694716 [Exidia glandulosa HHB12029]